MTDSGTDRMDEASIVFFSVLIQRGLKANLRAPETRLFTSVPLREDCERQSSAVFSLSSNLAAERSPART